MEALAEGLRERGEFDSSEGDKVHLALNTLRHLFALCVTAADERVRTQASEIAKRVQEETGEKVEVAYVDQGYTGENTADNTHS